MAKRQAQVLKAPDLALNGLNFPVTSINVIQPCNKLVFAALGPLVKILLTVQADAWETKITEDEVVCD